MDIDGVSKTAFDRPRAYASSYSGDPRKDNVETVISNRVGKYFAARSVCWPAKRGDRPKTGRERRVEHIGVAGQGFTRCHCSRFGFGRGAQYSLPSSSNKTQSGAPTTLARDAQGSMFSANGIHFCLVWAGNLGHHHCARRRWPAAQFSRSGRTTDRSASARNDFLTVTKRLLIFLGSTKRTASRTLSPPLYGGRGGL